MLMKWSLGMVSTLVLAAPLAMAQPDLQPGRWELRIEASMGGMVMPAVTVNQCLTLDNIIPDQKGVEVEKCDTPEVAVKGNTVTWSIRCEEAQAQGEVTYAGATMTGSTQLTTAAMGMPMTVASVIHGKRVGPCQ